MGSPDIEDAVCRRISKSSGMKVVSVGYRLAPKYKFPIGLDDCVQASLSTFGALPKPPLWCSREVQPVPILLLVLP
jgi:versiconal hemiacetal acetate esterase